MQTTAIRTVANSLPEKGVILLTLLISDRYILFAGLEIFLINGQHLQSIECQRYAIGRIYLGASAIANKLALLSASEYLCQNQLG